MNTSIFSNIRASLKGTPITGVHIDEPTFGVYTTDKSLAGYYLGYNAKNELFHPKFSNDEISFILTELFRDMLTDKLNLVAPRGGVLIKEQEQFDELFSEIDPSLIEITTTMYGPGPVYCLKYNDKSEGYREISYGFEEFCTLINSPGRAFSIYKDLIALLGITCLKDPIH